MIWGIKTYIIAYVAIQNKMKIYYPSCQSSGYEKSSSSFHYDNPYIKYEICAGYRFFTCPPTSCFCPWRFPLNHEHNLSKYILLQLLTSPVCICYRTFFRILDWTYNDGIHPNWIGTRKFSIYIVYKGIILLHRSIFTLFIICKHVYIPLNIPHMTHTSLR